MESQRVKNCLDDETFIHLLLNLHYICGGLVFMGTHEFQDYEIRHMKQSLNSFYIEANSLNYIPKKSFKKNRQSTKKAVYQNNMSRSTFFLLCLWFPQHLHQSCHTLIQTLQCLLIFCTLLSPTNKQTFIDHWKPF